MLRVHLARVKARRDVRPVPLDRPLPVIGKPCAGA
jgi:hypothetical protein